MVALNTDCTDAATEDIFSTSGTKTYEHFEPT